MGCSKSRPLGIIGICLIALLAGGPLALAEDQLYWVEAGAIRYAAVDGSDVGEVLSAAQAEAILSVALDPEIDAMFWSASGPPFSAQIRRATLQGGGMASIGTVWSEGVGDIAIDLVNDKLYYTDPSDCVPDCGSVWRMDQDGTNNERILMQDTPFAIAVYPAGGRICWGDQHNQWIRCSNFDGNDMQTIVVDTDARDMAVDPTSAKLYWTDEESAAIRRSNLDGSDVEDLVTGLGSPWGIALDPASDRMYWTDQSTGKIQSAGLDGSNPTDIVTGLETPRGIAFLPRSGGVVPAVSSWGLLGLTLLMLVASTVVLLRDRGRRTRARR